MNSILLFDVRAWLNLAEFFGRSSNFFRRESFKLRKSGGTAGGVWGGMPCRLPTISFPVMPLWSSDDAEARFVGRAVSARPRGDQNI